MTELKLTYFNLRARGETARLILNYAGVDFEDDRVEHKGKREMAWDMTGYFSFIHDCHLCSGTRLRDCCSPSVWGSEVQPGKTNNVTSFWTSRLMVNRDEGI